MIVYTTVTFTLSESVKFICQDGANYIFKFRSPNEAKKVRDVLNRYGVDIIDHDVHEGNLVISGIDDFDIDAIGTCQDLTICF